MAKLSELHEKWMQEKEYREEHARLAPEQRAIVIQNPHDLFGRE